MVNFLKDNFARGNQNKLVEMKKALEDGDIKTAHRLAHSLKGNAGQIGEKFLQEAAAAVEAMLSNGKNNLTEALDALETELKLVLEKLAPLSRENVDDMTDHKKNNSLLIIDDESSNIIALKYILSPDYTIYEASNGQDGIEMAAKHLPDVILLDIIMPDIDGYEVLSRLKSMNQTREIPVIFITGLATAEGEEKGLSLGASDYITKPFVPEIVKLRVQHQIQLINQINMIKHLSMTDQLTEIPNKRHFNDRLRLDWDYARRSKSPISILLIDIDFFKKYNDTYGHLNGDLALRAVAKIIKESLSRAIDFAARWGGEEFVVLLPATELPGALNVAETVRKNIENATIACANGEFTRITVSIGVNSCIPMQESSIDDFIAVADKALYVAKKLGRNRVCKQEDIEP